MQHLECWTGALLANIFTALILCSREPFSSRDYNMLFQSVLTLLQEICIFLRFICHFNAARIHASCTHLTSWNLIGES